jgi:amino-acid N-acetyltransferase
MTINIRKAKIQDVLEILNLVKKFAGKGLMLERSEDEVLQNLRDYFVAIEKTSKQLVGCASLHIYTSRLSEIKALAVEQNYRYLGLGKRLVKRCLKEARDLGLKRVFALTYVKDFFKKLKFEDADKNMLPEKIWLECSKCAKKNSCDEICLVYLLKDS